MRPRIRRTAHALVAALLIGALCGFGWLGRVGGNVGAALQYITSTYVSTLAQNGWVTPGATYTPFVLSGTATGAGSPVITTTTNPGSIVGAEVYDDNYYQTFPFGTTVSSISGTGPYTVTLSQPSAAATPPNSAVGLWISPAYPVSQWTWDAAKTTNQPPNALSGGGGTALASFTAGSATVTGVNNIFGAPTTGGWWATSGALAGPVLISSISGSAPNYTVILATGAATRDTTTVAQITIQPNEPTIIQYSNSAAKPDGTAGTTPAATFSGYVVNTTLNVTSTPTAALAVGTPIYYPATPADIPQGAYITACPGGVCTGTGAYTISDSIAAGVVGTSISPVALQTMGTVGTFHTGYGVDGSGGAFSFATAATYEPGDVYTVLPAIYTGEWDWITLISGKDGPNCGITTTAGSAYVSYDCAGSATDGLAVGDTVRDSYRALPMAAYISGTTLTLYGADFNGQVIPQAGEPLTGGGVASGTIIIACPAIGSGCDGPGNYTVGCETGYSGGCASQTVGSAAAPATITAEGNWPQATSATVTAVYPGGNASCPLGTGHVCFQVSPAASFTKVSADNWGVQTERPMQNVTVEGITGPINGAGSYRPAVTNDSGQDGNAYYPFQQGIVYIGAYDYNGYVNNLLFRNIDIESNGLFNTQYLLWFGTGVSGTTTFSQMRVEGQIWSTNVDGGGNSQFGTGVHSADPDIFGTEFSNSPYTNPALLSTEAQFAGTLNLENDIFDRNGGSDGPAHNIYMGAAPNLTVNLINSWSHDATVGHLIKSRAGATNIIGSYLQGGDALSGLTPPQFTASLEASGPTGKPTLVVTNVTAGTLYPGMRIMAAPGSGTPVTIGTAIEAFIPGTGTPGGAAQYTVTNSQAVPSEAMEGDYYNDCGGCAPVSAESDNAEFPCAGAVAIKNTIMTKGMAGPGGAPNTILYGAEQAYYTLQMTAASTTPMNSAVLTFTTPVPSNYNTSIRADLSDETNPSAFPWGSPASVITDGSTSVTISISLGEVFTASFSGTSMDVTGFTSGTGAISVGAPLWDASGLIPAGTVVTACPGGNCSATGTYTISQSAGTIASETAQTSCATNVCQPVQAGDTILLNQDCPWSAQANNRLYVENNDFVNFHSTYYLDYGHQPIDIVGYDNISQLPGDSHWPFNSPSDWSVTDNIFAGFPAGANNPNSGQDNSADTAAGNLNLYFADWPWTGTAAAGQGSNAHVQLVTSPAEFSQSFQQTFVPHYGDASGSIVGILSYVHAAMDGVARGDEALGAVD